MQELQENILKAINRQERFNKFQTSESVTQMIKK